MDRDPTLFAPPAPERRLASLARADKWVLSGLDGVIWAPPFPEWLEHPGFWDPAHILHYAIGPLFSVALLDAEGREVPLRRATPDAEAWRPDRLRVRWLTGAAKNGDGSGDAAAPIEEERRLYGGGIVESLWRIPADREVRTLVAYTAQPFAETRDVREESGGLAWTRRVVDRKGQALDIRCRLEVRAGGATPRAGVAEASGEEGGGAGSASERLAATALAVVPSQGNATPHWRRSPWAEGGAPGPGGGRADPDDAPSWVWAGLAVSLDDPEPTGTSGGCHTLRVRFRLEPGCRVAGRAVPPTWEGFWAGFPAFETGDVWLDRAYEARVFGLGLNRVEGAWTHISHAAIAEGIEYFHVPITYSAQCHMMEMRWRAGGDEAWGSLLNFLENQRPDGGLHGRLYPNHLTGTDYYHANWGDAVRAVHALHPDRERLESCYQGLSRFADWLRRERDPEGSGMFTVVNHYETGQEYMSRYMAVDPRADVNEWLPRLHLKGIDVTVYAYRLFEALHWMAGELGSTARAEEWSAAAAKTGAALEERMWSEEQGLFTDVDGATGRRTDVKAAVGFYPLLTDRVTLAQVSRLLDHLENPATFGTPFPIPSSSVDDPYFSAEGRWKGIRRNCPWNGRVWPMTTSHLLEGLLRHWSALRAMQPETGGARALEAGTLRARVGHIAARLLRRFMEMMFTDGDPGRPNCFEHYNPFTGQACHFRGIDDYQHSWVVDLLVRGFGGVEVNEDGVRIDPLPHRLPRVRVGPLPLRGREGFVHIEENELRLDVAGRAWVWPRVRGGDAGDPSAAGMGSSDPGGGLFVRWEDLVS